MRARPRSVATRCDLSGDSAVRSVASGRCDLAAIRIRWLLVRTPTVVQVVRVLAARGVSTEEHQSWIS